MIILSLSCPKLLHWYRHPTTVYLYFNWLCVVLHVDFTAMHPALMECCMGVSYYLKHKILLQNVHAKK